MLTEYSKPVPRKVLLLYEAIPKGGVHKMHRIWNVARRKKMNGTWSENRKNAIYLHT